MLRSYATGGVVNRSTWRVIGNDDDGCFIPAHANVVLRGESGCELQVVSDGGTRVGLDPTTGIEADVCDHDTLRGHSAPPLPCSHCPRDQHEMMIAARIMRWLGPPRQVEPVPPRESYELVFENGEVVERRVHW
jgi:hypothetical protein